MPTKQPRRPRDVSNVAEASKVDMATATLFLIGGDARFVVMDELAIACHRLAPDVFSWPEYLWLPNLDSVRVTLVDVKRRGLAEEGSEARGRTLKGIRLTQEGREWIARNEAFLGTLRRRLPDPTHYAARKDGELVAVAVLAVSVQKDSGVVSRERVVAEAFRLFPDRFALPGFAGWPDSARVEQAAREFPWIVISKDSWSLDTTHRPQVELVRAEMHVGGREGFGATRRRQVEGTAYRAVRMLESTPIFQRFKQASASTHITEDEVCDILAVTLESKPRIIQQHLEARISLMEQAERWDLVDFLKWIGAWCKARNFNLIQ
jgi:hypothetical protein